MVRVNRVFTALLAVAMVFGAMGALTAQTAYGLATNIKNVQVTPSGFSNGEAIASITFDVQDDDVTVAMPVTTNAKAEVQFSNGNFDKGANFNAANDVKVTKVEATGTTDKKAYYTVTVNNLKAKATGPVNTLRVKITDIKDSKEIYNKTLTVTVPGYNGSGGTTPPPTDTNKPDSRYTVQQVYASRRVGDKDVPDVERPKYDLNNLTTASDASIRQTYYVTLTMRVTGDTIPAGVQAGDIVTKDMGSFVFDSNSTITINPDTAVDGFFEVTFQYLRYSGNSKKLTFNIKKGDYVNNVSVDTIAECVTRQEAAAGSGGGNNNNNDDDRVVDDETPYVIVSKYGYGGGNVTAGQTFSLSLTFYNTSEVREISNMMITITMPDDLMLTSSSNTFYVPDLHKLDSVTKSVQVTAKPAAKAQSHNVGVSMKYQYVDENANARRSAETTENVAIPVVQVDRFEVTSVDLPMESMLEEETSVTVNYVNKGRSDVYNIAVSIDGDIQNPGQNQNMGNLASGATGTADFFIRPNAAGMCNGLITITYEDTNMEQKTATIPYNTTVKTMEEMNGGMAGGMFPSGGMMPGMGEGEMPGEEKPKSKLPIYIIIGVVVAIPVIVVIKKKVDKKRREKEDADL